MDPSIAEFLKIYGPLGLGWPAFFYVLKIMLDRGKEEIDAKVKLAVALETLTMLIKDNHHG